MSSFDGGGINVDKNGIQLMMLWLIDDDMDFFLYNDIYLGRLCMAGKKQWRYGGFLVKFLVRL